MKRGVKIGLWLLGTLLTLLLLVFFFISSIAKWAITKYDKEFIGREVSINRLWINLLSGNLQVEGFVLYEPNDTTPFISVAALQTHIHVGKALKGEYEVTRFFIDKPQVNIFQRESHFNFDDLLARFASPADTALPSDTVPLKWSLSNFQISDAQIAYTNNSLGNTIALQELFIKSPSLAWNKPEMLCKIDFNINSGGRFSNLLRLNTSEGNYSLNLGIQHFNLASWYAYLREIIQVKSFKGELNTRLHIAGNINKPEALGLKGLFNLHGIEVIDPKGYPLLGVENVDLLIDSIQVSNGLYKLASLDINKLFCVYEMYPKGSNFDRLFAAAAQENTTTSGDTASIPYDNPFLLLTYYTKDVVNNQALSQYSAQDFSLRNSHLIFRDYTLQQKFNFELSKLQLTAANLRSASNQLKFSIASLLNRSGNLKGNLSIDPKDFKHLDFNCNISNLRMSDMNPYMVYYIAHPFLDGLVNYTCKTRISAKHELNSENKLSIKTVYVGKKQKNKTAYDLPVKLAIALLRDYKGNINLEVPVEGNLDDPHYKLGKVIWGVVKNIFVKAAMAPYQLLASMFGGNEAELKEMKIGFIEPELSKAQTSALDKVARILAEKTGLHAEFIQVSNNQAEAEEWGMFYLKKDYLLSTGKLKPDSFTQAMVDSVNMLPTQDSLFVKYVASRLPLAQDAGLPIQEQMHKIISNEQLMAQVTWAMNYRNAAINRYLVKVKRVDPTRLRILNTPKQDLANTETVSKYVINYFVPED